MSIEHADTAQPGASVTDSLDPDYRIRIDINDIRPKDSRFFDRFLKRGGEPAFIVGRRFNIEFQLTNVSRIKFPGGELLLSVRWTSEIPNWYWVEIPPLAEGETTEPYTKEYSVIDPGFGRIFAEGRYYSDFEQFEKSRWERSLNFHFDLFLEDMNLGDTEAHVGSIFGQTVEEFYQLWAMILAAIGLFYFFIKDIIGLLSSWILPCAR